MASSRPYYKGKITLVWWKKFSTFFKARTSFWCKGPVLFIWFKAESIGLIDAGEMPEAFNLFIILLGSTETTDGG